MKSCLIVDDSRVVRKVAARIVSELGFSCEEAENGQEALDACQSSMPDAVLLNWHMPVMNGLEFLETLRALENGEHPKIIFCTTENKISSIEKAMDAGADEYIMKPFDSELIKIKFTQVGLIAASY